MKAVLAIAVLLVGWSGAALADQSLLDLAQGDNLDGVRTEIAHGADVNAADPTGATALFWAAYRGDAKMTALLIKAGAKVNVENRYGASAMSLAATRGATDVARLLLKAGADVESANPEGETALMLAARAGALDLAKLLVSHGANVNAVEHWGGQTALMWAAAQNQPEMVKFLISKEANVDTKSAARYWQRRITSEPRPKDMNDGGFSALHYAARDGCVDCVRYLAGAKANLNATDPERVTPLIMAIFNYHFDTAKALIEAGADVNRWDWFGRTPLYLAVDTREVPSTGRADRPSLDKTTALDIVKLLLDRGANPDLQLKLRPPYRQIFTERGRDNILFTGATPLLRAARGADLDCVRLLLGHGPKVDLPDAAGITPLMAAAGLGQGARVTRGEYRTEEDSIRAVRLLLDAGADINALTYDPRFVQGDPGPDQFFSRYMPADGETALHGAAKRGWTKMVEFLVKNGAKIDVADEDGKTPLDFALGRYPTVYLEKPPQPLKETVAALEKLCAAQAGCTQEQSSAKDAPVPAAGKS